MHYYGKIHSKLQIFRVKSVKIYTNIFVAFVTNMRYACTVYIKVERCQHIATTKTPQPPPPPCHLMAEKRKKNDSHFGILLISQSLYFQIIADLNIGRVAWAQARNNKVVIATRLCFTKSLHILSLLNAKVVFVFSDWKRIETEIDMPAM